ncbi:MAG: hypothetical protein WCH61_05510 [bacterium]
MRSATAILPVLLVLAASLAGCDKPVPTAYDPVPNQVVRETFTSLFQDPPPQVIRQLHRLQDCMPEQSFPAMALRQEELRQIFGQLNARLQRGDLAGARQLIALAQKRLTPLPELVRTEKLLDGLAALDACQKIANTAHPDADAYANAFAEVTRCQPQLDAAPTFRAWYAARQSALTQLLRQEAHQRLLKTARDLEQNWLAGRRPPGDLRTALSKAATDAGLGGMQKEAVNSLTHGQPASAELAANSLAWSEPEARLFLEMALARNWRDLTPAQRAALPPRLAATEPLSPSGILLRARAALDCGEVVVGRRWSDRLDAQQPGLTPILADDALAAAGLGRARLNASPWLAPIPTVTDLLKRLLQLGETPLF